MSTNQVWAAGANQPSGDPPFGVAPQQDAKGTRLIGVFVIEFFNSDGQTAADGARGIVRLRKGSQLEDYNAFLAGPVDYGTAGEQQLVQGALIDAMGPEIVSDFIGGTACSAGSCSNACECIKVKRLEEFVQVDAFDSSTNNDNSNDQIFVMNIELAVD